MEDKHLLINRQRRKNRELQKQGKPQKVYDLLRENNEQGISHANGEKFAVCASCGETFEQHYIQELNSYQSFKTCQMCRLKKAKKMEEEKVLEREMQTIVIDYSPYPWQKIFHEDMERGDIRFAVLDCGARCLTKGTFIAGANKLVENICADDLLINKTGNLQNVTDFKFKTVTEDFYKIKAIGIEPFEATKDHGVLVQAFSVNSDLSLNKKYQKTEQEFLTCEQISKLNLIYPKHGEHKRYYLAIPRIKGNRNVTKWDCEPFKKNFQNSISNFVLNEDFAWLCGLYCAEGNYDKKYGAKFTLNVKEIELHIKIEKILTSLNLHFNKRVREQSGTCSYIISKTQFAKLLDYQMGHGAANKKIPLDILYHQNENILISFLKGYFTGDGYYNSKIGEIGVSTISQTLASQIQLACARLGHLLCLTSDNRGDCFNKKLNKVIKHSKCYILKTKSKDFLSIFGYEYVGKKMLPVYITDNSFVYTPIKKIDVEFKTENIYSLSTKDESFLGNSVIMHNCGKDRASNMDLIFQYARLAQENRHLNDVDLVPSILMWIVAPTFPMAQQNWRELKHFFPKEWVVSVSDSTMTMQCAYGGIVEVRSGHDPESLVGVGLDFVTITEAARIKELEKVWGNLEDRLNSPKRGLGGKGGKAVINSSPNGKNYFYKMWRWGNKNLNDYDPNFKSYKLPTTENPDMAVKYAQLLTTKQGEVITYGESLRRRKGRKFLQDNLAEFIGTGGTVFEEFTSRCVKDLYAIPELKNETDRKRYVENWKMPKMYHTYRIGYDPATGSSGDMPALLVRENETNNIVVGYNMTGKKDDTQWNFVALIARKYNNAEVCILSNGFLTVPSQLVKRGCIVKELPEGRNLKASYVQGAQTAVQDENVHVLDDGSIEMQDFIAEVEDYTEKENGSYSNDTVDNDDYVSCFYALYHDYNTIEQKTIVPYTGQMIGIPK